MKTYPASLSQYFEQSFLDLFKEVMTPNSKLRTKFKLISVADPGFDLRGGVDFVNEGGG